MTPKEFAQYCSTNTRQLSVYISRGKVLCDDDGDIDPDHPTNIAFRQRSLSNQTVKQAQESGEEAPPLSKEGIMPLPEAEQRKKHFDAVNAERNAELLLLKTDKLKGEVIPVAPIETLIFQFKQHVITQNKTTLQTFLVEIGHKYEISPDDLAYYKGYYIELLNKAAEEANSAFIDNLGSVLAEFTTKRGVGERQ